jgi:CBS domain-containing protein
MSSQTVSEVMQSNPICLPAITSITAAAVAMRDIGIGDVIVQEDGEVCGIVTDRDITVRVVAEALYPDNVALSDICSRELTVVAPSDSVEDVAELMSNKALRRLPVLDEGRPVGIVSLGDLELERDPRSVLAAITLAPPNI